MIVVAIETQVEAAVASRALETALAGLRRAGSAPTGHHQSRFFQAQDDPSRFLYLGTWESREAYEEVFGARQRTEIERGLAQPVVPRYFRSLVTFERVLTPMEVLVCQVVEGPAEGEATVRSYMLDLFERRRGARPGVVLSTFCQEIDQPGNFLLVTGWQTAEALMSATVAFGDEFAARVAEAGATYRRFVGQTRFDSTLAAP